MPLSRRRDTDRAPVVSRREGEIRVCIPRAQRDRPDADLARLSLIRADTNTKRETGRTAQLNNIAAAKVRF